MLLRAASSQGLASRARYNSDREGSSLSNAHSDFVARAAALVVPGGNVRRLRDAHPVQTEVASQSGSAPHVCANPQPESLPASFSRPSILRFVDIQVMTRAVSGKKFFVRRNLSLEAFHF